MTELSPAAQAVLDAVITDNQTGPERFHARAHAAAALRAAVATAGLKAPGGGVILDGNFLLDIAAELEGRHG